MSTTNKDAYAWLINNHVHWTRTGENLIMVWTSGYKCADHYTIERVLMKSGMRMIGEAWDPICGKTSATYRHN